MNAEYLQQLFGLSGQLAVVIGGTGVLGGAISQGLAAAGACVVVAGRGAERGKKCVQKISQEGGKAIFASVDVTSRDSINALLTTALDQCGRVDMLVNCAGVNSASSYLEVTDEKWDTVIETNLKSTHVACQVFGKHMISANKKGSILNIGSVTAHLPLSRVFAYSASKAAVVNLTQNVAREFAPMGVRVNAICPGFFPAEQNRAILDKERVENIMRNTPMARFGEPQELVGTALLLLSRTAGSFITGATMYVDGGFTSMRF